MPIRIASATVAIPVVALFVWFGAPWFSLLIIAVSMIATAELCSLVKHQNLPCSTSVATIISGLLITLAYYLSFHSKTTILLSPFIVACAATGIVWLLLAKPGKNVCNTTLLSTAASAFYVGGTLFHAPLLISMPDGQLWVLFLLAVTSGMDTCAYLFGKFMGKHAMAPQISPSKTWEGAIGGALCAVSIALGTSLILNLHMDTIEALLAGLALGVAGQVGDLVESRIKRKAGVKDSGKAMPGHGGFLDRLDSIVFNLVVLYYFLQ